MRRSCEAHGRSLKRRPRWSGTCQTPLGLQPRRRWKLSKELWSSSAPCPPPPRHHRPAELDITLERLRRAREVCLLVARLYGDHCAKVAWSMTLATLDKADCAHMDALAAWSIVVAITEEVVAAQRRTQKVSKVLL